MAAWRCKSCLVNYPKVGDYQVCPTCEEGCDGMANATPITVDEAQSIARHAQFNREYEKYDAERCGPSPEDLGREEGRRLAAEFRALEAWVNGE